MPEQITVVDISELQDVEGLCRVCLTESKTMFPLHNNLDTIYEDDVNTIQSALAKLRSKPLINHSQYPSLICSMCLSLLNIAYKFVLQLELSQKQLSEYFGELSGTESNWIDQDKDSGSAPVEIISSKGKYNLQDLIIVEEENTPKSTYEGFLKNLGTVISAKYVQSHVQKPLPEKNEEHIVNVIALSENSEIVNTCMGKENDVPTPKNDDVIKRIESPSVSIQPELKCSKCSKTFIRRKILNRHMKDIHLQNNDFLCQICGHVSKTKSSLYYHMMHHGNKFECMLCGKKYVSKNALQYHEAVHRNERLHLCTVCGKSFNYANALQYHMRLHTGEKKYECTFCSRAFTMQCGLSRHLRTHTGTRPYACRFCDKAFRSKGEVNCHEMLHTGYRPYTCKICGKGFTKTHNLKVHMLGHSGPHTCEFCHRGFIDITYLKLHMRLIHGLENYELNSSTVYFVSELEALDNLEDIIAYT